MAVIAVYGASTVEPETPLYDEARALGRALAERGHAVATGGYAGLMEAVSSGAADAGGHVIGFTAPPVFPRRSGANSHVTEERPADTLAARIAKIQDQADAAIALDGSIGTLTELLVAWNSAFVARFSDASPKPVIAVGPRWSTLVAQLALILETDQSVIHVVDDPVSAVEVLSELL